MVRVSLTDAVTCMNLIIESLLNIVISYVIVIFYCGECERNCISYA